MLEYITSTQFRRDFKKLSRNTRYSNLNLKLKEIHPYLIEKKPLPSKYLEHKLSGKYLGCLECHLAPDLLLVYRYKPNYVEMVRLGCHSDLF